MDFEKIKSFVYYGAENYSSIDSLRKMLPQCYLFLTFLCVTISIVGKFFAFGIVEVGITLLYSLLVYTFHLWCPKPSFPCRFITNALDIFFLSLELQLLMYTILFAVNYTDFWGIALILGFQMLSAVLCIIITIGKIKNGKYIEKKQNSFTVSTVLIVVSSSFVYFFIKMLHGNMDIDNQVAGTIFVALLTPLFVLFAMLISFQLLKYYYAKKYRIFCDESGRNISQMLIPVQNKDTSPIKAILWGLLIFLMVAVLYGVYQVSRGA